MIKTYFRTGCLVLAALLLAAAWTAQAGAEGKIRDRATLMEMARGQGQVRVMVKIFVQDIEGLTQNSVRHQVRQPGQARSAEVATADAALASGIRTAANKVMAQMAQAEYQVHHIFKTVPWISMSVSEEALLRLDSVPEVLAVVEDRPFPLPRPDPSDPEIGSGSRIDKPALDTSIGIIGANNAWAQGYTGSGWYVAVLDTGVRTSHEFFTGKTFVEACFNTNRSGTAPDSSSYQSSTTCPNSQEEQTGSGAAWPPVGVGSSSHGTHCAGIAAGRKPDNTLFGVAKDANIFAVNVFSRFVSTYYCGSSTPCLLTWSSDQTLALEYVYSQRGNYSIAAASMSLGSGAKTDYCDGDSRKDVIDRLRAVGIATVIASGNDSDCTGISAPACISSSVAIGATNDSDAMAPFSNWHQTLVDLFAPGSNINSSLDTSDTSYGEKSGTSMATPHVAGAFAILRQRNPTGTVSDLENALKNTGHTVQVSCGSTGSTPRIQVDAALGVPDAAGSITYPSTDADGSFNVSWGAAAGATSYKLQRATSSNFSDALDVYSGSTRSYDQTGLPNGTYYYRAQGVNPNGAGAWKAGGPIVVSVVCTPPDPPLTLLYPSTDEDGSFTVSWSASSGATGYTLERATNANFSDAQTAYSGSSISYNQTGLAEGTYYFRVNAQNSCGSSAWRTGGPVLVCNPPDPPLTLLYPSTDEDGSFTVSWSASSGATGYTLERAANSSFSGATTAYSGPLTSFAQTGLATGTYYYRVNASKACGTSTWKTGSAISVCIPPAAPGSITYPSYNAGGGFTVSWGSSGLATAYTLERADNSSFTGAATAYSGPLTSYSQTGLNPGTYYFRVKARNNCGASAWTAGGAIR
ncbi:MAG: S8 family serine peptidase, partial [Proteobacteria bacterium]|nr:S8 family serine peptidase [Pseudomonadota bacterium]